MIQIYIGNLIKLLLMSILVFYIMQFKEIVTLIRCFLIIFVDLKNVCNSGLFLCESC